jgi:hypothetical protein
MPDTLLDHHIKPPQPPNLFLRVLDPDREEIVLFILPDEHYGTAISPAIQKNRSEAE